MKCAVIPFDAVCECCETYPSLAAMVHAMGDEAVARWFYLYEGVCSACGGPNCVVNLTGVLNRIAWKDFEYCAEAKP